MQRKSKIIKIAVFLACFICTFAFFIPNIKIDAFAEMEKRLSSAKAMAVIEQSSGRVLYEHNKSEKLPMASTTKIITAIFVIENTEDLDKVYAVPAEAAGISGTSIGLKAGEHLSIRELLYGLMLRSGNDAAVALAILTEGSEEEFIKKVNIFLQDKIKVSDTKLANPHGLPTKEEHYTTAIDLAKITAYAMNNETFKEIVSTSEKEISNELKSKFSRNLKNKNKLLSTFEGADGVKTGYTKAAGRCFVGSATRNGMQVICVLLNDVPMFEDCASLLEKAFKEYELVKLIEKDKVYKTIKLESSKQEELQLKAQEDIFYPLSKEEKQNITLKMNSEDKLTAPIKEGQSVGTLEIYLSNQLIFSHEIYNINYIENNSIGNTIEKVIDNM